MPYHQSIFKAYDIRGKYPAELDEDVAGRLGQAVARHFGVPTVAVAWDVRLSSPALCRALIAGLRAQGVTVVRLGLCSTDAFYFAVSALRLPVGVMVTASHNPAEYNGFKIVAENAAPVSEATGLRALKTLVEGKRFPPSRRQGTVRDHPGVLDDFAAAVRAAVDWRQIKPLRVVMDAGNGAGGLIAPKVFAGLPLDIIPLCFAPDGRFPNHQANPLLAENRRDLAAAVRARHADLGIAWDADADRCFFVDEEAEFIPGDFVTAQLAKMTLQRFGGGAVVYDLRASHCVPETVRQHQGTPVVSRVGHTFIKAKMRELDAVFGGEVTGHYYYRFAGSYLDNGFLPALQMLVLRSQTGKTLRQIFAPLKERYHISGELNFRVADTGGVISALEQRYVPTAQRVDHLDGLTIEADGFWFNVRPSNTEPLLRVNIEAESPARLVKVRQQLSEQIALVNPQRPVPNP